MYKSDTKSHPESCLNCGAALIENAEFCPHCGQKTHLHRLSIGHILHDGVHFFLHADKSIFTLIKALASKTGTVAREFVEGKRKKYFAPLNFYLIIAALMVFSMTTFNAFEKEVASTKQQLEAIAASIPDPAMKAKVYTIMKRQSNAMFFIKKYSNMIGMCAVPLISLLFYLFYCRGRYNYAEHLVANLYAYGLPALGFSVIILPLSSLPINPKIHSIFLVAYFVLDIVFRSIYYYWFMNKRTTAAAFKAVGVVVLTQLIWLVIVMALVFWYMKSGMNGLFA